MWPDGEDFIQLVSTAVKDRRTDMAARMRDKLAEPDVIGRTVAALETLVDRIDEHLRTPCAPEELQSRRERARDGMWDSLIWYRTVLSMVVSDAPDS
jgi:hypothetical protein